MCMHKCVCVREMNKSVESCTRLLAIYEADVGLKAELINSHAYTIPRMYLSLRELSIFYSHAYFIASAIVMNKGDRSSISFDFAARLCATLFCQMKKACVNETQPTRNQRCTCKCFAMRCIANG